MTSLDYAMTCTKLRDVLAQALPGLPVQLTMSPQPRPGTDRILDPNLNCRRAGVLVLIYPCGGEPCVVLTRRTDSVDNHRGQISFPGGSLDAGEDAITAALREGWEELGIDPARLEVIGALSPLYIPPSGFCVYPTVALAAARPDFIPNPHEVAEVIEAPLALLLAPDIRREEVWEIRGAPVRVPFYAVGQHKVWGATAMVLCELLALLQTAGTDRRTVSPTVADRLAAAYDPRVS
jgi:8-oxo-dGTP pyrophosphatase MutT (NUDIX family)